MSQTLDNLSYTWNNAGTTFTGIKYNVTNTASASGSLLMDLQVGGTSKFNVDKLGATYIASSITAGSLGAFGANGVQCSKLILNWGSGDVVLERDAANTLAQRNSTNAQEFRLYNTYTDASNYERAKFKWDTNVLKIGTEKAGTGTARALELQTDGTTRLTISATGALNTVTPAVFGNNSVCLGTDVSNSMVFWSGGVLSWSAGSGVQATTTVGDTSMSRSGAGVIRLAQGSTSDFNRLQFGGTTSSFPALKRSTTTLEAVLADDSGYTNIKGKLTTHANAVAETPTATHTLTIYDAAGTAYKVLAVAA